MPKIIDPDDLTGSNVVFDTNARTIELVEAGNLDSSGSQQNNGVTLQALYSYCKEQWRTNNTLIRFEFPFIAITPTQFELHYGWKFKNSSTMNLIRDGGWAVKNTATGASLEEYTNIVTLGSLGLSDQVYYQQQIGGSTSNVVLTGPVNQAVKVYGDASNGNFDRRGFLKLFVRVWGKTYASASLTDIGVTELTYQSYALPLSNAIDIKITNGLTQSNVNTTAPYTGMSLTYHASPQSRTIGASSFNFNVIVNGNGASLEKIYEFVQNELTKATDIDDGPGTVIGQTADDLLRFTGNDLRTLQGVFIDNFDPVDTNRVSFTDNTGTVRTFPFKAGLSIQFNNNLQNDAGATFAVFFKTLPGANNDFGESGAVIVNDSSGTPMSGQVSGNSSVFFDFDYDGNNQGGRTPATEAQIVVVAIGLNTAQYVITEGTIARSTSNVVSLVSPLERNYRNN